MEPFEVIFYDKADGTEPAKDFLRFSAGGMVITTDFKALLSEQSEDPESRAEWDALQPDRALVQAMIDARQKPGLP